VECRPNTNKAKLWKTGHAKGEVTYKKGSVKEGGRNMVDVLYTVMNVEFLNLLKSS
jgi:hypothetical protein